MAPILCMGNPGALAIDTAACGINLSCTWSFEPVSGGSYEWPGMENGSYACGSIGKPRVTDRNEPEASGFRLRPEAGNGPP